MSRKHWVAGVVLLLGRLMMIVSLNKWMRNRGSANLAIYLGHAFAKLVRKRLTIILPSIHRRE
jgi:hypothetical protein